jgi:hypothetical protein
MTESSTQRSDPAEIARCTNMMLLVLSQSPKSRRKQKANLSRTRRSMHLERYYQHHSFNGADAILAPLSSRYLLYLYHSHFFLAWLPPPSTSSSVQSQVSWR